jgi:hypothetical protein
MGPGDKLFLFIQKVRNPAVVGNISTNLTVETRTALDATIDSSTFLPFGLQEVLSPGAITADNTNFKVRIHFYYRSKHLFDNMLK